MLVELVCRGLLIQSFPSPRFRTVLQITGHSSLPMKPASPSLTPPHVNKSHLDP